MTPRLVATDLDGTLVGHDGLVSEYTRSVLQALDARGVPVIFVTGRPLRWAMEVFEHVGSHGLAVVSNGALVWDVAESLPRMQRTMAAGLAVDVARRLREAIADIVFGAEATDGWRRERGYPPHPREVVTATHVSETLDDLLDRPILKLLARSGHVDPDEFVSAADAVVGTEVNVTHSSFPLLEISAPEVTKASTLALLCAELGIAPEEVIAFGDMPNDVPMLSWAGTSYAMKDAHPSVVSCAVNVAPSHADDGVARVLAEVFAL